MLAGCSNQTQGTAGLPGTPSASGSASGRQVQQFMPGHKLSPMELLKLQAAGKIPGPSPVGVMKRILTRIETKGQLHVKAHRNAGTVSVWAASTYDNAIIGLKKNLTKTVAVIGPTYYNNCYYPTQIKVDHAQNIWAGCQYNSSFSGGAVTEWSSAGSELASYSVGCPNGWGGCDYGYFYSYGTFASAADASHVFAAVEYAYGYKCSPSCSFTYGGGVEWWPAGQPSATPTYDALPYFSPVEDVYYMDEDSSGNLWLTFYGCENVYPYTCGNGLGEISNPTSPSWTFTTVENPGTYMCAGGVYVSNAGAVLNVTDPCTRYTYQYALPLSVGGGPMKTLGPTPTNAQGNGSPVSGGFSQNGAKLILGDSYGWLDRGIVSSNTWKAKASINVYDPEGAAFTPSDK
jgi:hypothetical protein